MLGLLLALALAQGSSTMAGPAPASTAGSATLDYFTSLLVSSPATECACTNLTLSGGESLSTTRASAAYCTASTGAMTSCTNNLPRANNAGLLVEAGRTNAILRSAELDNGSWDDTGTPVITADTWDFGLGSATGETIEDDDGAASEGRGQTISTATTGDWTCAVSARSGTLTEFRIVVTVTGGTGTTTCAKTGLTSTTSREFCTTTAGAGVSAIRCEIQPGADDAATGTVLVGAAQLESGITASSYIPTSGTSAARANENISFTPGQSIGATGCSAVTVTFPAQLSGAGFVLSTSTPSLFPYWNTSSTLGVFDGSGPVVSVSTTTNAFSRTISFRSWWSTALSQMGIEIPGGLSATPGAFDGTMDGTAVYLGSDAGGGAFLNGYLRSIKFGTTSTGCAQ